jgi:hypothetical protein
MPLVLARRRLYAIDLRQTPQAYAGTYSSATLWTPGARTPRDFIQWHGLVRGPSASGRLLTFFDRRKDWQGYQRRPRRNSPRQERCQPCRNNFWVFRLTDAEFDQIRSRWR